MTYPPRLRLPARALPSWRRTARVLSGFTIPVMFPVKVMTMVIAMTVVAVGSSWSVVSLDARAEAAPVLDPDTAIREARRAANAAAERYFAAEAELDQLERERDALERATDDLVDKVEIAKLNATEIAIDSFVGGERPLLPMLSDTKTPIDREVELVLSRVAINKTSEDIDSYDDAVEDLARTREQLDDATRALEEQQERLDDLRESSLNTIDSLRTAMTERSIDGAQETARQAGVAAKAVAEAEAEAAAAIERDQDLVSAPGGRTGRDGAGNRPIEPPAGMLCPVAGASGYADTWGQPRSGGRSHQGVDMLASSGTPLQAVVSGRTVHRSNRLGGITVSLYGDDGTRYYYAHLASYEGSAGPVTKGQVIGYVGDTGNATGIPHLHFEIHPGGGPAVNPYRAVVDAGC